VGSTNILWRSALLLIGTTIVLGGAGARAAGTLTVGMTAGDLPQTTGNPDQGFEGYRFVGYNLYDSLVLWDLSQGRLLASAGLRTTRALAS
jgi:peptide/nickel transport system substrate-binding protein